MKRERISDLNARTESWAVKDSPLLLLACTLASSYMIFVFRNLRMSKCKNVGGLILGGIEADF